MTEYDPAQNSRDSYALAVATLREERDDLRQIGNLLDDLGHADWAALIRRLAQPSPDAHAARPRVLRPSLPEGERVVSLVEHRGLIVVATSRGVFVLKDGELVPVTFQTKDAEG